MIRTINVPSGWWIYLLPVPKTEFIAPPLDPIERLEEIAKQLIAEADGATDLLSLQAKVRSISSFAREGVPPSSRGKQLDAESLSGPIDTEQIKFEDESQVVFDPEDNDE